MILPFLIAAWITITPLPQQTPDNSVMLVEFRIDAPDVEIMDPVNYNLTDESGKAFFINTIDRIYELDGIEINNTKIVAITTERLKTKTSYTLDFKNNKAWFYYNGFAPNKFETPVPEIGR